MVSTPASISNLHQLSNGTREWFCHWYGGAGTCMKNTHRSSNARYLPFQYGVDLIGIHADTCVVNYLAKDLQFAREEIQFFRIQSIRIDHNII
ncbi:hypothetical protein LENED_009448 [Lentinula edodes]|uniref:Uncharacterized protein n=1 Tax=Lentinula edodes TaxID=5353 RepID=A0A1Q3EJQ5_LENED|nr:hypothetical protein LENED_009448 [Lentinula edodes]